LAKTTRPEPPEAPAPEDLGSEGLEIPFVPARISVPPLADQAVLISRVLDWGERRRLPLGLLFSALIGVAAFAAYQAQLDDDQIETGSARTDDISHQIGPLAAAVEGLTTSDGSPSNPAEASGSDDETGNGFDLPVTEADAADNEASSSPVSILGPILIDSPQLDSPRPPTTLASSPGPTTTDPQTTTTESPTTTGAPPTTATPTTSPPPTPAPQPVKIAGRVDTVGAREAGGIEVALYHDRDGDGTGDTHQATVRAENDGDFTFNPEPGCYVVRVVPPSGYEAVAGQGQQSVCLSSGQRRTDLDLAIVASMAAPHYCEVETGWSWSAGVLIEEPSGDFAPSYLFYGQSGNQLYDTATFGPPDYVRYHDQVIKWTSHRYGFDEQLVYSVAARGSNGQVSARTTCERWFLR
jgi:hypothetical protein